MQICRINSLYEWLEKTISKKEINFTDYKEFNDLENIFESTYSSIYKAEWTNNGLTVAHKTVEDVKLEADQIDKLGKLVKELQLWNTHENINKFYGVTKDPKKYRIVLLFAYDGNLRDYLKQNKDFLQWTDKFRIAKEIARGLLFLHGKNIVHRDLHPKNILINKGSASIADFGLVNQIIDASVSFSNDRRSVEFVDPQCFEDNTDNCNVKSDVYSYGVILWEISSCRKPFHKFKPRRAIAIHIYNGIREDPIEGTPREYVELYTQCWDSDPVKRPEISMVLDKLIQIGPKDPSKDAQQPSKGLLEKAILDQGIDCYNYSEFSNYERIAIEEFSSVYKSIWKDREQTVALKCLKVHDNSLNDTIVQGFINKLKVLQKVDSHPNIIRFYGVTKDPEEYYNMILYFAEGGNLREYLNQNFTQLQWTEKLRIAKDIAEGLKFLHDNGLSHHDLHPKNILVHEEKMIIAGFGISEQIEETSLSHSITARKQAYIEPQCFLDHLYKRDMKSDIYSFGVILWEISPPFQQFNRHNITIFIFQGRRESPAEDTPQQYQNLYTKCWDANPINRPEINSVIDTLDKLSVIYSHG
ncbi:kinase-like domain-containing protein [Gigaspora rosea]|uniref:Kinase-like domain-containing protein n=1 Tax=Gigaspora rosea TaxID=44941 RepID=A0A397VI31_9GLOM|nr:kinase-like domain-containing protein [Gigaspora rosea]